MYNQKHGSFLSPQLRPTQIEVELTQKLDTEPAALPRLKSQSSKLRSIPTFKELIAERPPPFLRLPSASPTRKRSARRSERKKAADEANMRQDYFENVQEPGFGRHLAPKRKETLTSELSGCRKIDVDSRSYRWLSFPAMLAQLEQTRDHPDVKCVLEASNLSGEQIAQIFDILDKEPVIAAECAAFHSVDKLDVFCANSFLLHTCILEEDDVDLNFYEPVRLFRDRGLLLIFSKKDFSLVELLEQNLGYSQQKLNIVPQIRHGTVERLLPGAEQAIQGILFLCLFTIMRLTEPFVELMLRQSNRVQRLALSLSYNEHKDFVHGLGLSQSLLNHLLQSLQNKRFLMTQLLRESGPGKLFTKQFGHLMRHIQDRFSLQEAILQKIKTQLQISHMTFGAHVDQGLQDLENKLNNSNLLFAGLATIFLPLTLISGIFGMNVTVPWQREEGEIWPFWVLIGIMVVFFFLILWFLKCRRMI